MSDVKSLVFKAKGSHTVVATKLAAFLKEQDDAFVARRALARKRARVLGIIVFILAGSCAFLSEEMQLLACIFAVILGLVALWQFFTGNESADELAAGADVLKLLRELGPDLHRRTPVRGRIDFGEATDIDAYRGAKSPFSGAQKFYYRHVWLDLAWGMADGSLIWIRATNLVKTKRGSVIRREHQIQGQILPNAARYKVETLPKETYLVDFQARTVGEGDKASICFWQSDADIAKLGPELARLYQELAAMRRPQAQPPL